MFRQALGDTSVLDPNGAAPQLFAARPHVIVSHRQNLSMLGFSRDKNDFHRPCWIYVGIGGIFLFRVSLVISPDGAYGLCKKKHRFTLQTNTAQISDGMNSKGSINKGRKRRTVFRSCELVTLCIKEVKKT